jgi:WD40 repeat protein
VQEIIAKVDGPDNLSVDNDSSSKLLSKSFLVFALRSLADVAVSKLCPGLLVTASEEGEIQIWDYSAAKTQQPSFVARREMGVGKLMFVRFCPDEPFVICCGGDYGANTFAVWDLRNTPGGKPYSDRMFFTLKYIGLYPKMLCLEGNPDCENMALSVMTSWIWCKNIEGVVEESPKTFNEYRIQFLPWNIWESTSVMPVERLPVN